MARIVSIQVPLLNEGTEVSRPADAEWLGGDRYRIKGDVPTDEVWAFQPGTVVIVKKEKGHLRAVEDEGGDEEFWAEHDPYGDRFSKAVPLWGCLVVLAVISIAVAVLWRAVATSTDF